MYTLGALRLGHYIICHTHDVAQNTKYGIDEVEDEEAAQMRREEKKRKEKETREADEVGRW